MIKKLLFICLWTVLLSLCACLLTVVVAVIYSKGVIHFTGARPSAAAREAMAAAWTNAGMIMMPIALLLGVFGKLPGTRMRDTSPSIPMRLLWCYRTLVGIALCGMMLSILGLDTVGDCVIIGASVISFIVAGFAKYFDIRRQRRENCPEELR